ncbi:MAG: glycosyltransferase [Thermodesulfovibrionales bacterium]
MSRRLAFIDHSFHQKSTATFFLMELLRQYYQVEIFWDESWIGGDRIDPKVIAAGDFDAIIFFQLIDKYTPEDIRRCRCKNVILIPMYDHSGGWSDDFWLKYRAFKIVNFSRTLHERLAALGMTTRYFQFFLPPVETLPQSGLHGFFWQRTDRITWAHIRQLIEGAAFKSFHLHLAVDPPGYERVLPSEEEIRHYNITVSEWFEEKEDYFSALSRANVFFASRHYEGIGMSFIEAVARGMCIIAPGLPTMNEYIRPGFNGFLYDPASPEPLDLSSAAMMGNNSSSLALEGYRTWSCSREELLKFVAAEVSPERFRGIISADVKHLIGAVASFISHKIRGENTVG